MLPAWYEAELVARGGAWSALTVCEPKVRHGRAEVRMVWTLYDPALNAYAGSAGTVGQTWPHLGQVARVDRRRTVAKHGVWHDEREVTYAATSLPASAADARAVLGHLRAHWGIENKLHYVRDVTFDEDRSQTRIGAGPQVMAALRNLALTLLRRTGATTIAAALRTNAGRPADAVALVLSGGSR